MDMFYEAKQLLDGKKRRALYLPYLLNNGLNASRFKIVGEIGDNIDTCLSRDMNFCGLESVLISTSVDYDKLKNYGIKGLNGYVNGGELYYNKPGLNYYQIDNRKSLQFFDAIYSMGFNKESTDAMFSISKKKKFIGQCVLLENKSFEDFYDGLYPEQCKKLNDAFDDEYYSFTKETDKSEGVAYYLIKNKF